MKVFLNNELIALPSDNMTVAEFTTWRNIPSAGTAVAINDRIIRRESWNVTHLSEMDRISVITAAFGG